MPSKRWRCGDRRERWIAVDRIPANRNSGNTKRGYFGPIPPIKNGPINWRNEVKTSEMIQSKFLKKDDFPTPAILTIKNVSLEEVGRGDTRWVLYVNERAKGIVLNVTKIKQLENKYGYETDDWIGKKFKAENDPSVMMGTQVVGGIKFTMPSGGAPPVVNPPPPVEAGFEDDIPF